MSLPRDLLIRMEKETIEQIEKKWEKVNISFYYFYDNTTQKNFKVMQVASWWIEKHNLPHFVRATTILEIVEAELKNS